MINFSGVYLMNIRLSRLVASVLTASLVLGAPGPQAWGQVAASARAGSAGAIPGAAVSLTPAAGLLSTPALTSSAPSLAAPSLAPAPAAPAAAPAIAAVPAAALVPAAPLAAKPAALTAALPALTAPAAGDKNDGALGRLSSLFDGLLVRRPAVDAVDAGGPSGAPRGPELGRPQPAQPRSAPKPAAKSPARKPFVPATRVVAAMEKLLVTDPAAALKTASASIVDEKERRAEVKIGAQRILDALPIEMTLTHYLDLLTLAARPGIQTSKDVHIDPWWYLQRTALKRLTREAPFLKPGSPALHDLIKASYKDRNASVRLAAAGLLTALGVDPGPEVSYDSVRPAPEPVLSPAPAPSAPQAPKKKGSWLPMIILFSALAGWWAFSNNTPSAPPVAPPAIEQTIKAPAAITAPAGVDSVKADPKDAALEQIARDTKRTADAAERSAKAAEEMAKPKGTSMSGILMMLAMAILPIFLLVWLMKRMMGGGAGGQAGGINTRPKMDLEKPNARFDDVAGIDESLVEVQEIIDFLREPARFRKLGARMPKGILMEGPPGTGKTLLARALAGETSATFISISGSDFVELYVGMGARRVRELFETARKNAPAIIFIDEIDAVGKKRGDGGPGGGSNDEREQTINQILKEMDGFDNSSGVLVVAATNRADTLDAALTRPGRFDRKIHVGLPEAMGREAILALHAKKARLAPEVDLRLIARRTAGLSGAFLENVINEAALLAARRGADSINGADIDEAVDRATIGGKRSLRLSEPLKRRIAAHEAGHVLANLLNENAEARVPVNKVTIMPHGSGALGFAESGSEEGDKYLYTRAELEARLDTALGGLVAEKIFYGEWSTGPGSDLESATRVARAMVQQLGMSEDMGLAQTAPNQYGQSAFGGEADAKALVEVNKLLKASMERTEARLRAGAAQHKAMIEALMDKETLSADEIEAIAHPRPKR
ncbi:MAG: ATP-dependent zinc metalloprotease FtsH [Elusimicrobia bacterium]|nr:ATP-dependent zinc metalloprotease FtsH [Elusimicrobiota bacterium]